MLLFGASGVFGQLQNALNTIWEVEPKPGRGVVGFIRDRFFSFAMVLGTAFLLLVSLVISTGLSAMGRWFSSAVGGPAIVLQALEAIVSLGIITLLFALIFKVIPDAVIAWKDVVIGAFATAILFGLGKWLLGIYVARASLDSTYGLGASLVVVLLWVYYSSQILFLGAEFTQAYARMYGSRIRPSSNAVPATAASRAEQGLSQGKQ